MYSASAILLKTRPHKEADSLLSFYTKEYGKVTLRARSVRRAQSKLSGHLQYFSLLHIRYIPGKYGDPLTAVEIANPWNLSQSFGRQAAGFLVNEVVDVFSRDHNRDERLWQIMTEAYDSLEHCSDHAFAATVTRALLELLETTGWKPVLDRCVICGSRQSYNLVSVDRGGIVCSLCAKKFDPDHLVWKLNDDCYRLFQEYSHWDKADVGSMHGSLLPLAVAFVQSHLREPLKSYPWFSWATQQAFDK